MFKNISFLTVAGAFAFAVSMTACILVSDDTGTTTLTTGDGDGDGDGPTSTGDGDGDVGGCGWIAEASYYGCGGVGDDPDGAPSGCPDGLVADAACDSVEPALTLEGCCDADGNNWYCGTDDNMVESVALEVCG